MFNALWGFLTVAVVVGSIPMCIAAWRGKPDDSRLKFLQETLDDVEDLQMELERRSRECEAVVKVQEVRLQHLEGIISNSSRAP